MAKNKTWVYVSDIHGDRASKRALQKLWKFLDEFQPDIRILGGDLFDFRALRRGASEDEQYDSLQGDRIAGFKFLDRFEPHVFLLGNHDARIHYLANSRKAVLAQCGQQAVEELEKRCKTLRCKLLPYHAEKGVHELGDTKFIHGFHHGMYATKQHAQTYGKCVHGHTHSPAMHVLNSLDDRTAYGAGAMCQLWQEYNLAQTNTHRHRNGIITGTLLSNGFNEIEQRNWGKLD